MGKIRIGLFGFGVVGQGIYEVLRRTKNVDAEIVKICVRSLDKPRPGEIDRRFFTDSADEILLDPAIDLIVEVIDDAEASYRIVKAALERKIPVVSGNKAMLANHLQELIEMQKRNGVALLYDASSCGSIPVIRNLEEYYDNDLLLEVKGILNGSSNYILSRVFDHQCPYAEALAHPAIEGLVIGTRPDCMPTELLDYLEQLSRQTFLIVEYGIESANNDTLKQINRGHTFECAKETIERTAERGITTGGHIIIGLPGEDRAESLRQAPLISDLRLDILKIHQMQIIKGTRLADIYDKKPFHLYTAGEYVTLISEYISMLRSDLILERFVSQSPKELLVAPQWGLKNHEFTNLLNNHLKRNNIFQGQKHYGQ